MEGQTKRWKDGQTQFYRTHPLITKGPKKIKKKQQFVLLKTNFRFDQSCRKNVNIDQIFSLIFYGLT